jgi:hypothetical protein
MDDNTFNARLNDLVSEYLEASGHPGWCAEVLRNIADEVFEEPDEARGG